MFSIPVIKGCPVVKASRGVITFDRATIAMIAGAVRDNIEWIVLLNGRRSEDGYEVHVDHITVPQQRRSGGHAEIAEQEIAADVVGVMHSHHRMGAFFSGIDTATLNPRFPSSIVVAISQNNLGFEYEAEGKVVLPCGSVGRAKFHLSVRDASKRFQEAPVRATHETVGMVGIVGDCGRYEATDGRYERKIATACGLAITTDRPTVFGLNGNPLLEVIEKMTLPEERRVVGYLGKGNGTGSYGSYDGKSAGGYGSGWSGITGDLYGRGLAGANTSFDAEIDMTDRTAQYTFKGGCDWCYIRGVRLRMHLDTRMWLCGRCYPDIENLMAEAKEESKELAGRYGYDALVECDGEVMVPDAELDDGSLVVYGTTGGRREE